MFRRSAFRPVCPSSFSFVQDNLPALLGILRLFEQVVLLLLQLLELTSHSPVSFPSLPIRTLSSHNRQSEWSTKWYLQFPTVRVFCPGRRTKCNGCLNRRTGESVLSKFRQNIQAFQPALIHTNQHEQLTQWNKTKLTGF